MSGSARSLSLLRSPSFKVPADGLTESTTSAVGSEPVNHSIDFIHSLPCVIYECDASMELTFLSGNVLDLLGFEPQELVGHPSFWEERLLPQDLEVWRRTLKDLNEKQSVTWTHRMLNRHGLPVWVNHGLRQVKGKTFRGCFLSAGDEFKLRGVGQTAVERFVHKLGNHFTLLQVVLGSLRRVLPQSREAEVLHETVDRTIDLTRSFSEYNQKPGCWTESVDMVQVVQGALMRVQPLFQEKKVQLEDTIDLSIGKVSVAGDPFLLELALGHILQNALEATGEGRTVTLAAKADATRDAQPVVVIEVKDTGAGIEAENLSQVMTPFFTTKGRHEGLGLTMACRFVEMHSGMLRLKSEAGRGTELTITLPALRPSLPSGDTTLP